MAYRIPRLVQDDALATLLPGPQIHGYNTRIVLVHQDLAEDAISVLSLVAPSSGDPQAHVRQYDWQRAMRPIIEFLVFGWFMPIRSARARFARKDDPLE